MLKNILVVFGTRPEAIKMAPICHELKKNTKHFNTTVCVTAQHREMLDQVLDLFNIVPDEDLNIMEHGQDLTDITSSILISMRAVFKKYKPDLVLVHGDTTTTLACSMAGFYADIPIGHVEAGLRTNNIYAPFPEEFNRQVVSKVARIHFAPTESSGENLIQEKCSKNSIFITGNTVIDSLHWVVNRFKTDSKREASIVKFLSKYLSFDLDRNKFILITGHRRENFGKGFVDICEALSELAVKFPDMQFVYPVHLNPNVQEPVNVVLSQFKNIHLISPLDYEPFIYLLTKCFLVLTDSGGIQEEAPSIGKPVLVMRDVTERPEAVTAGTVKLVGANKINIVKEVSEIVENQASYLSMSQAHNPYGDGNASKRIINQIKRELYE